MSGPPLWDFVTTDVDVVHLVKLLQCQLYHRCGSRNIAETHKEVKEVS